MESIQQTIAPYMVIQHSLGMWTLDSGYWNRDSLSVDLGFRIPTVVSGKVFRIAKPSQIPQAKIFPAFWNLYCLTLDDMLFILISTRNVFITGLLGRRFEEN